ncbi:MAG: glycosyl transferase family protein [Candidatus Berkelbacteria bacterium Gr01-1014_85]|uniref:Glycosyl transferase family protein n=1 Tax=Candidatus Berkelbacteria bacterium Gr01-1014_85 TaxID=2017150 RepID=A0A554J9Z6_9BACT|nr:MAG: glycosyl transferase family protein [Candidatus Berkelbacteria bacterium Gr01-1014_85]
MTKQPMVTVIILNWQQPLLTLELLADLERLDYANYRVVVVDNGSRDNSKSLLLDYIGHQSQLAKNGRLELMPLAHNIGFAEGNNRAVERYLKQSDYCLFLNNDTRVEPNLLTALLEAFEDHAESKTAMVSPLIHDLPEGAKPNRKLPIWFAGGNFNFGRGGAQQSTEPSSWQTVYPTHFLSGCALLVSRSIIELVNSTYTDGPQSKKSTGGLVFFDPDFFAYNEDADLCYRLQQLDYQLLVTPKTRAYHRLAGSSGGPKSANFWYYNVRNNWLMVSRYATNLEKLLFWLYFWGYKPVLLSILGALLRPRSDKPLRLRAIWQGWQDYRHQRFGVRQL